MNKTDSPMRKWALLSVCAAALGIGLGAGGMKVAQQYFVPGPSATQIIHLPGGNLRLDSDIARFDTRTGAIYRFRGNIEVASVTNDWELRVPPVKEPNSGILEIQRIASPRPTSEGEPQVFATFLVDVVTGQTWILRHRASTNASWDAVDIYTTSG